MSAGIKLVQKDTFCCYYKASGRENGPEPAIPNSETSSKVCGKTSSKKESSHNEKEKKKTAFADF